MINHAQRIHDRHLRSPQTSEFAGFDASVQRLRQRRLAQAEAVLDTLERRSGKVVRAIGNVNDIKAPE